jgi:hypothetical protein
MILYILLILLIIIMFKPYKTIESMTVAELGIDIGAIKTLSDLANDLMKKGNLTIPGALVITGGLTVSGESNHTNLKVNGPLTIKNWELNANDGHLRYNYNGDLRYAMHNPKAKEYGLYSVDNIISEAGNIISKAGTVSANKLYLAKDQRKYIEGGRYHVRGHGANTPLYNGWNFLWQDGNQNWTEWYRKRVQWNGSSSQKYFHYSIGNTMVQSNGGDVNWMPRFLIVMPGFKAKLYFHISGYKMGDATTIYTEGEYELSQNNINPNNRLVHIIALALVEEELPADNIDIGPMPELVQ